MNRIFRRRITGTERKVRDVGWLSRKTVGGKNEAILLHLLGKQITAESDAPPQNYCGEVTALCAFLVGPRLERRGNASDCGAKQAEQPIVQGHRADAAAFVGTVRTELQNLNDAREVVGRNGA